MQSAEHAVGAGCNTIWQFFPASLCSPTSGYSQYTAVYETLHSTVSNYRQTHFLQHATIVCRLRLSLMVHGNMGTLCNPIWQYSSIGQHLIVSTHMRTHLLQYAAIVHK